VAAFVFCALLAIFHRPVLLTIGRLVVRHYVANQHLNANFQMGGNVFSNLTLRNLHVVPAGPSEVESIDARSVRTNYNLISLLHGDMSNLLRNIELDGARIVLNPSKAQKSSQLKKSETSLPAVFPKRIRLKDVTLIVRNKPHDLVVRGIDLDLEPQGIHKLRVAGIQLPQGQRWTDISAETSYANRDLVVRNLVLGGDRFRLVKIDASRVAQGHLGIDIQAELGGGSVTASMELAQEQGTSSLEGKNIHLVANGVDAADFNKYAGLSPNFIRGRIDRLQINGSGLLRAPNSWSGDFRARLADFGIGNLQLSECNFNLIARNGKAQLQTASIVQGDNQFQLHGFVNLPARATEFARSPAQFEVTAEALNLAGLTLGAQQPLTGSAHLEARINSANGRLNAELDFVAPSIGFQDGTIENARGMCTASKTFEGLPDKRPWFAGFEFSGSFSTGAVRFRDYSLDGIEASVAANRGEFTVKQATVTRNENRLVLHGSYQLPASLAQLVRQPAIMNFSLAAPALGDLWVADSADKITGTLRGSGQLKWHNGLTGGQVSVESSHLETRNLLFQKFDLQCSIADEAVQIKDFTALLDQHNFVRASGTANLKSPYQYDATVAVSFADLSVLTPALRSFGNQNELAGSLQLDWQGSGEAKKFENSGRLKLVLNKGRYGTLRSLEANVNATYSPEQLDIPTVFVSSDQMDFQAIVQAKGRRLEITKIQLDQGKAKYASGYVSIPFVWKNLGTSGPLFPSNGQVTASFQSEQLDLQKLFGDLGAKPVAAGTLNVRFAASGTLTDLNADLDVALNNLRSEKLPSLKPATVTVNARVRHHQLDVVGKLEQSRIQPLQLTAKLPFDFRKIAQNGGLPGDTPVTGNLRLAPSSVNFVRELIPDIRQVDGSVAIDAQVTGTVSNPVFAGTADMKVNYARANNVTIPALQNFQARLQFENNALIIRKFGGELSAGHFSLGGRVTFTKLTAANLDLQFKASNALIVRNDTLTVRIDADLGMQGPLNSASMKGDVKLTDSRFLKNIDLIPIGLPGRPAPQPPASYPQLVFPPPFKGWKFDVTVKTEQPVLIRGNLAAGKAIVDMRLTGSGWQPQLQGLVRLENMEATLPFSRLEVSQGFLYFVPNDPLNPRIDLQGTSVVQDYRVRVYVYGTVLSPQVVFSSEPPLPQEDIISLLATGTTRQELAGNNTVLASRAAILLVQQLYRKMFKKGEPVKENSLFDRLSVSFGGVNPRTGQQEATARYKINDNFALIGDVGVEGGYRGMLKYVIHFE
jgi:TamB, inner membrane protein subunit of TAM complex